jgi:hypothetical protein
MSFVKFTLFEEEDSGTEGDSQFSNIIEEEEYESETDIPGFEGFQKGFSEEEAEPILAPRPWDPSEPAWALLDDSQRSCKER